jgi:DNA-binding LacI/PurR family transcriptional regulator
MALTLKEIARLTQTSPTAVSFVLNNKAQKRVSEEKRKAILEVVKKYGYRKNVAARGLALNRTFRVGLCIYGFSQEYPVHGNFSLYETISLTTGKLNELGYSISLLQVDKHASPADVGRTLAQEKLDGILFLQWDPQPLKKLLPFLKEMKTPVFALGSTLGEEGNWVSIDRESVTYKATSYLLGCGLTHIMMLGIGKGPYEKFKHSGYKKAMRESGLKPYPMFSASPAGKSVSVTTKKMLDSFPETQAIFVSQNIFAPSVMETISKRPIRIIGFGHPCFADLCERKLSYVRFPTEELVDFSVKTFVSQIESPESYRPQHKIIECDLVIQET